MQRFLTSLYMLLIALVMIGCHQENETHYYANGYYSETIRCSSNEFRWKLWKTENSRTGLISELAVVNGSVVTFMPTVVHDDPLYFKERTNSNAGVSSWISVLRNSASFCILITREGELFNMHVEDILGVVPHGVAISEQKLSDSVNQVERWQRRCNSELELQIPCSFEKIQKIVAILTNLSGDVSIQSPSEQEVSWQDRWADVDAERFRWGRQGPDIPIFLPDQPVSKIARDFTLASCSYSATNLEYFAAQYSNECAWAGKALVEAGNKHRILGKHEDAIIDYTKAISLFGTNIVPRFAPSGCITVADFARMEMTRSLKVVSRHPDVVTNINLIQNSAIREALRIRFCEEKIRNDAPSIVY